MNRLARERSPYLLQHANNPVEWFPWGNDAFEKSRQENKPIFLSIGYSTCHWCHVMEHESFENDSVAAVINEHFVAIKVDREERPDVDRVYMQFVQRTTGAGGWPMSVWLTPDLKPFYGGTYFPPESKWGRPGFVDILQEIARVWGVDRAKIEQSADAVTEQLGLGEGTAAAPADTVPDVGALAGTLKQFTQAFDKQNGGFGDAPKFPRPSELFFLLREHARTGDAAAREMALRTLTAMAVGGMRDHIGGGFHRYSVDGSWRVPHFEKMLYDQAQLVLAYIEASQASDDPFFLEVAEDTLRYVMRDMTDKAGGFFSAEDADSIPPEHAMMPGAHKTEGAFYLWTNDEIEAFLGKDASVVKRRYGMGPNGNAPFDPQAEFTGKNLLYQARTVEEVAVEESLTSADTMAVLARTRTKMFEFREMRPRPHLDDKVLTAWNGLMISAFAKAARAVRGESRKAYLQAALRAANFVHDTMWNGESRTLLRSYRDGHAGIDGYAEDYAFLVGGLLELFQVDPDPKWLSWAIDLQARQDELFWDAAAGGWFSTTGKDPSVLLRMKDDYDGAEPGASSISVMNLLVLSHLRADATWSSEIERTFKLFATRLEQLGRGVPMMSAALSAYHAGLAQVVIVGEQGADALADAVARRYMPFSFVLSLTPSQQQALALDLPLISEMKPVDGKAAAYVCRNFTCLPPVTDARSL